MVRTTIRTTLATVAATATLALGTGVLAAGPAQASYNTVEGCRSGEACIWPEGSPAAGVQPSLRFSNAGTYNLSNQENWHWVLNNQTQNWKFKLCTGWNGGGTCTNIPVDQWVAVNLSPINSVIVSP
ncbi:hypothetical protein ACFQ9Q_21690 [Streptomyces virginiae]|uniref:hypothetical protein n=1 Tax=Streptomyces virginiae TaxID=1961 RepID=UPI00068B5240|nr:hypothetical protein [Streptomyces virginiae]